MDIAMGSITASSINTALVAQADNTAGNLAIYRSDLGLLETYVAGGNAMTLLMATLKNTSGSTVDSMTVNYTMGLLSVTPGEQVAGHRVYWSKDGMTWTAVADFAPTAPGTTIPVSFGLTSLAWGPGELLYVVWADDNTPGGVGADGDYTIDGVSFGPSTGGGYAAWALAQVPPVTGGVDGDSNNDGVQNGIAYFMGATGFITNPVLDASNKVTWPKSLTYNGTWQVQISSDLSAWENVASTNDGSSISYTLEPGLGKKFVRLLVTPTP
jgi:hypothetical protein